MTLLTKGMGAVKKIFTKKAARAKGEVKLKKLNKKDEARFQGVYGKHMKALKAVNKPAVKAHGKRLDEIKSRVTKGKSKEDQRDILAAGEKLGRSLIRTPKDKVKMYDDLPDIKQRFRGAPGKQRKLVKGEKNWMRRAAILQKDRLKKYPPTEKKYKGKGIDKR
tara:strand:+ start:43 stop:534 length:492 start_codon:yes stop_codon:yes gene_type:complete